jgi:hypothetical protein
LQRLDHVVVEHRDAAAADCAEREFFASGDAEFADDRDVQGRGERARDLVRNRDAAAWESENEDIAPAGVGSEPRRERSAGVPAIAKSRMRLHVAFAVRPSRYDAALRVCSGPSSRTIV